MNDAPIVGYSPVSVTGVPYDVYWCDGSSGSFPREKARAFAWLCIDCAEDGSVLILRATPDTRPVDGAA